MKGRMKGTCGDALFLKPILSLKKIFKESWLLQMAPDFRTPPFFTDDFDAEFHPD